MYHTFEGLPNLPAIMKEAGYRTGMVGKLHILPEAAYPLDMWWNDRDYISFPNRDVVKMAAVADRFINEDNAPFFLTVNYPDYHLPFHRQQFGVPETPLDADDVTPLPQIGIDTPRLRQHTADYYNCVSRLDTAVGHLFDALQRSGKSEDTLVLFTTDHGHQFSRGKTCCYEGGVKVPSLLKWPGQVKEGQGSDARYKLIFNCLDDRPSPSARSYSGPDQQWEPGATVEEIERADPWILEAYATYLNPPREELYDLSNDPYEFRNLAGDPDRVDIQDQLRATLTQWQVETNDRIADPEILARLTEEHDAALAARYKEGGGADQRRQNEWRYAEYLR
tara:strand:+ start:2115 stop:3122 length:1008 start_codon:yes stop_codon:yes gene_type:complete